MEKEVDVVTLCNKLTEMTAQEKCDWKLTSEKSRFKLALKNGTVEISKYVPNPFDFLNSKKMIYSVSLFDRNQVRYATYESDNTEEKIFNCFKELYSTICVVLERKKKRKIALLFNELTDMPSNAGD